MDNRMLTSSSSSSSSSEEDNIYIRRPRIYKIHKNPFIEYNDTDFKMRFRVSKECVTEILELIGHHLEPLNARNRPVSSMNQLLITLRFYATGSFQLCTGDHFNVSKATVCRIISKVSHYIALLRPQFIQMPRNQNELNRVQNDFYEISGFPRVLGAVDCTHIRIQSPGGEIGEVYRNRKGWYSINVQAVCDPHLKIMNIFSRWPGSTHDSTIWNDSLLRARLEANEFPNCYLLGDSGYACKKYLLTPLLNPQTNAENRYNNSQIRTRNVIERTFGVLKRRFPCLSLGLRLNIDKTLAIIVATAVLHNIAIDLAEDVPEMDPEVEIPLIDNPGQVHQILHDDIAVRTALINTVFNR